MGSGGENESNKSPKKQAGRAHEVIPQALRPSVKKRQRPRPAPRPTPATRTNRTHARTKTDGFLGLSFQASPIGCKCEAPDKHRPFNEATPLGALFVSVMRSEGWAGRAREHVTRRLAERLQTRPDP